MTLKLYEIRAYILCKKLKVKGGLVMKKLLVLLGAICIFMSLVACGNSNNKNISNTIGTNQQVKPDSNSNTVQQTKEENTIKTNEQIKTVDDSIVYKNEKYGFSLTFPAAWKDKYRIAEDNVNSCKSIGIFHKQTWAKTGAGYLFGIQIYSPKDNWQSTIDAIPSKKLFENDKKVILVTYPSDVQYDMGDKKLAGEYQQMTKDINGIVKSFKVD